MPTPTQQCDDYVAKFAAARKRTSDDTLTPPDVYQAVLDWLAERRPDLAGREIVRPFFPGGDFENHRYPPGCVVVDNPPFSLRAKIVRFFLSRGVDFLLFAPGLSLFMSEDLPVCYVVCGKTITYAGGQKILTGFVASQGLFPGVRVLVARSLHEALLGAGANPPSGRPCPPDAWSGAKLARLAKTPGPDIAVPPGGARFFGKVRGSMGYHFVIPGLSDEGPARAGGRPMP